MGGAASHNENELVLDVLRLADPAFAVNRAHRIVAWNDAAERLLGLRADQMIGRQCYEVLGSSAGSACMECQYNRALAQRGPAEAAAADTAVDQDTAKSASSGAPHSSGHRHAPPAVLTQTEDAGDTIRCMAIPSLHLTTLSAFTRAGDIRIIHLLHATGDNTASEPGDMRVMSGVRPVTSANPLPGDDNHPTLPLDADDAPPSESGKRRAPMALTQRELEVLRLLGAGRSTEQIAQELSIARVTARNHVNKVLDKLGVSSRLQAVVVATSLRLI